MPRLMRAEQMKGFGRQLTQKIGDGVDVDRELTKQQDWLYRICGRSPLSSYYLDLQQAPPLRCSRAARAAFT